MAERQYIGARYVPKFYVNSGGTSEWMANTQYEALTVVTRNGNSYTSKIPVPASVGAPESNSDYWVSTGVYNQQIESIQSDVSDLQDDMNEIKPEVNELYGRKRTFILLGDSYEYGIDGNNNTQQVTGGGWGARCQGMLENMGHTVYRLINPLGGAIGFSASRTYISIIQYLAENVIEDADAVTDIIVLGGNNDIEVAANVPSAITGFVTYCKSTFANANIAIGCLGYKARDLHLTVEPAYKYINSLGGVYIGDLTNLMVLTNYLGSDGLHLTEAGYAFYSPTILNALLTFTADYDYEGTEDLTADTGVTPAGTSPKLHYRTTPNHITIWIDCSGETNIGIASPNIYGGNMNIFSIAHNQMLLHEYYAFAEDFIYDVINSNLVPRNRLIWVWTGTHIKIYWKSGFSTAAYTNAKIFYPNAAHMQ